MKVVLSGHKGLEAEVVEVDGSAVVAEFAASFLQGDDKIDVDVVSLDTETEVWLVDGDDPLDPTQTLLEHDVRELTEIVITRHKAPVDVTIHFAGDDRKHSFKRQRSMERVYEWAVGPHGFNLAADQRAQHELALVGSRDAVDLRLPLAAYVPHGHAAEFNLRRTKGYQG
jgi:hypothetical protein